MKEEVSEKLKAAIEKLKEAVAELDENWPAKQKADATTPRTGSNH